MFVRIRATSALTAACVVLTACGGPMQRTTAVVEDSCKYLSANPTVTAVQLNDTQRTIIAHTYSADQPLPTAINRGDCHEALPRLRVMADKEFEHNGQAIALGVAAGLAGAAAAAAAAAPPPPQTIYVYQR